MKKKFIFSLFSVVALFSLAIAAYSFPGSQNGAVRKSSKAYIVATDYMKADGKTDVTEAIQKIIDNNPNRTIYFPDGVYLISKSILTPADPKKSVSLVLDNYARFQAVGDWSEGGAVVRLGATYPANDINTVGSNYGLTGGIIDGGGFADGISIDGGRETKVQNVSIKHTQIGLHVKFGANGGSSDADIMNVNIVGNNKSNSIGLLVEGYDNTFTNMRIASVNMGVQIKSGGNSLKNIHPLFIDGEGQKYESSIGFSVEGWNNWLNFCYSDQFSTGFWLSPGVVSHFRDCFCFWYSGDVPFQRAIGTDGPLDSFFYSIRIGFSGNCPKTTVLKAQQGGKGFIRDTAIPDHKLNQEESCQFYILK